MRFTFPMLTAALVSAPLLAFGQGTPPAVAPGSNMVSRAVDRVTGPPTAQQLILLRERASKIIGSHVYNERGESIGEIEELLVTSSNTVLTAVISVGGFLGMGERLVSLPFAELRFVAPEGHWMLAGATKDTLQNRPVFHYRTQN